jgi:two-component SAPR family response regulator
VQGIIKEKQIRQRLEELKELKRKGFRTLAEADDELESKKKKEEKAKKKEDPYGINDKVMQG